MLQEAKRDAEIEAARKKNEKESPLVSLQNLYGTSVRLLALPLALCSWQITYYMHKAKAVLETLLPHVTATLLSPGKGASPNFVGGWLQRTVQVCGLHATYPA